MRDGYTQVEHSTLQLIVDQLQELMVTIVDEIRERPGVAAALLAGVAGAVIGSMFAASLVVRRRRSPPARVARRAAEVGAAAELAGLGLRLLKNPLVRAYLWSLVAGQLRRRAAR